MLSGQWDAREHRVSRGIFLEQFCLFTALATACQAYSVVAFGEFQTTTDAVDVFYKLTADGVQFERLSDIEEMNSPLPVFVWQFIYEISIFCGFGNGPWAGIMANSFLTSLALSLLVVPLQIVWPGDGAKLQQLARLMRYGSIFALAGATHLRDSWVVFYAALLLISLALIWRGRTRDILVGLAIFTAITLSSVYVRNATDVAYTVVVMLMVGAVMLSGRNHSRLLGLVLVVALAMAIWAVVDRGLTVASSYYYGVREINSTDPEMARSLATRFLLKSPLPIRAIGGSVYLYFFPIPIWSVISLVQQEYFWLKFAGALGSLGLAPYVVKLIEDWVGVFRRRGVRGICTHFQLVVFFLALLGFVSVALTSLESRHSMQFYPFVLVACASVPAVPSVLARLRELKGVILWSYGAVHLLYLVVKLSTGGL